MALAIHRHLQLPLTNLVAVAAIGISAACFTAAAVGAVGGGLTAACITSLALGILSAGLTANFLSKKAIEEWQHHRSFCILKNVSTNPKNHVEAVKKAFAKLQKEPLYSVLKEQNKFPSDEAALNWFRDSMLPKGRCFGMRLHLLKRIQKDPSFILPKMKESLSVEKIFLYQMQQFLYASAAYITLKNPKLDPSTKKKTEEDLLNLMNKIKPKKFETIPLIEELSSAANIQQALIQALKINVSNPASIKGFITMGSSKRPKAHTVTFQWAQGKYYFYDSIGSGAGGGLYAYDNLLDFCSGIRQQILHNFSSPKAYIKVVTD